MNQKEETYLQGSCVSLPIYCSSRGFCTFFPALFCFSVLNAAEAAARAWFWGWIPSICTKCNTELVWGAWEELWLLPCDRSSVKYLDRQNFLTSTDQSSYWLWWGNLGCIMYLEFIYQNPFSLRKDHWISEALYDVKAGVCQQILDALCFGGFWCHPHLHRLFSATILYSFFSFVSWSYA